MCVLNSEIQLGMSKPREKDVNFTTFNITPIERPIKEFMIQMYRFLSPVFVNNRIFNIVV